jgi:hypothetical protein
MIAGEVTKLPGYIQTLTLCTYGVRILGCHGGRVLSEQAFQEANRVPHPAEDHGSKSASPHAAVLAHGSAQIHAQEEGPNERDAQFGGRSRGQPPAHVRKKKQQAEHVQGVCQQKRER